MGKDDKFLVFKASHLQEVRSTSLPSEYSIHVWLPTLRQALPPSLPHFYIAWSAFHALRLFRNRFYRVYLVSEQQKIIHRTCVVPAWFRWPFMDASDVQISTMWTDERFRGQGLAAQVVALVLNDALSHGRPVWYACRPENLPSLSIVEKYREFSSVGVGERVSRLGSRLLGVLVLREPQSSVEERAK